MRRSLKAAAWSHRWTLASAAFCFATLTGARRSYPTPALRLIDRAALSASGVSSATQDTDDTHRALRRRIARFEDTWREAWQAAAEPFAPTTDLRNTSAASRRHWAIDCYRRTPTAVPVQLPIPVPRRPIVGNGGAVRFLIDQQQFPQAVAVARACTGNSALCADLTGMAYHYAGDIVAADSAFRDAEALRNAGRSVNAPADRKRALRRTWRAVSTADLSSTSHGKGVRARPRRTGASLRGAP